MNIIFTYHLSISALPWTGQTRCLPRGHSSVLSEGESIWLRGTASFISTKSWARSQGGSYGLGSSPAEMKEMNWAMREVAQRF